MARAPLGVLYERACDGERRALGQLLSIIERGGAEADLLNDLAYADTKGAAVIGITGAPGAGKSTLTGALTAHLLDRGHRPAVLAVDPSSPLTGGAILGDRIRMDDRAQNATHPSGDADKGNGDERHGRGQPFIRSMATRGHVGGLALAAPAALRLFDVAGYDPVILETVGIGQVEVDVASVTDTTIVVVTPGWGDSVQANKSGLLEVADVFVVNKADRPGADQTKRDLELMLDLSQVSGLQDATGYRPPVVMTTATASATGDTGVADVWDAIERHRKHLVDAGQLDMRRRVRVRAEVRSRVEQLLLADAAGVIPPAMSPRFSEATPPSKLAAEFYQIITNRLHKEADDA